MTTAQLLIRWGVQNGFITIPKSFNHKRIVQNTKVFDWTIDKEDFKAMVKIAINLMHLISFIKI